MRAGFSIHIGEQTLHSFSRPCRSRNVLASKAFPAYPVFRSPLSTTTK
jgi:hypothetical protein